jgi:hypothetical protein
MPIRDAALGASLLLAAAGCQYGPEHLPALRANRDAHLRNAQAVEDVIIEVEKENGLAHEESSVGGRADLIESEQALERCESENAKLGEEADRLKSEKEAALVEKAKLERQVKDMEEPWFKSLSLEQQLQWRIHRDLLPLRSQAGGREGEEGANPP